MKKLTSNETGFIPLLLTVLAIVAAVIYFVYIRVHHASH
jgi:sorbitol-specific phosphotransferase system component IIC